MNDAFNWWLLIVGLVVGAGLVWLVLADSRRRDVDVAERERASEARWIGEAMRSAGRRLDDADALDVLRLHEAYLEAAPPDEVDDDDGEEASARWPDRRDDRTADRFADDTTRSSGTADRAITRPTDPRAAMAHRVAPGESVEATRPER